MGIQERKEREKEARREEIIKAAQKVFSEKDLQVATMDEIADAAELSKGTLYLYYRSKEDLYLEFMMKGMRMVYDTFEELVRTEMVSVIKFERLTQLYYKFFLEHRPYFRSFAFFVTPQFHHQVSEDMREACKRENDRIWRIVFQVIGHAIDDGYINKNLRPEEVAVVIWSSANALMTRIDYELEHWKTFFHLDIEELLMKSNALLLQSMLTDSGRAVLGPVFDVLDPAKRKHHEHTAQQ